MDWDSLAPQVRKAIESQAGPILDVELVADGFNSEIAAVVHTDGDAAVFVKGLRCDHPRAWTQHKEAIVNPHVVLVAPRLLWQIESSGWSLLGFEYVEGRRADYSPGSPDLALITDTLRRLGQVSCPDLPLKRAESRWSHYCDVPQLLEGGALLHTDWNPANVLINHTAHLVDWAWPTYGAPWIDPACWVVWLVTEGHTPAHAERWAAQTPAWASAPAAGMDAFALAQARMWADIADDDPWARRIADAAQQWATHRRS